MGATLLKEAARKTVREAGDGTTTATVLAHSILKNANKIENPNTRSIKEGINEAVEKVIKYLEESSIAVDDAMLDQIATISTKIIDLRLRLLTNKKDFYKNEIYTYCA